MPRILVIGIFAILTLGIIGGGTFLVWQKISTPSEDITTEAENKKEDSPFKSLPTAEQASEKALVSTADDDSDGLSNSDELIWGTDSNNPDTDGDGYLDGEEVLANHDPTKPAPDDLLTVAQDPTTVVQSEATQQEFSLANTEQYFAESLDISGGTNNLTDEYEENYTKEDRSPATMNEYAAQQVTLSQLPRPDQSILPDTKNNSPALIAQYLATANNRSVLANSSSYSQAQYSLYSQKNPAQMLGIANTVGAYRDQLQKVPVPEVALPAHVMLLGYTELLVATFEQIALWEEDPVKSMVATRQLETIDRKYYPIIQNELQRLEALQQ